MHSAQHTPHACKFACTGNCACAPRCFLARFSRSQNSESGLICPETSQKFRNTRQKRKQWGGIRWAPPEISMTGNAILTTVPLPDYSSSVTVFLPGQISCSADKSNEPGFCPSPCDSLTRREVGWNPGTEEDEGTASPMTNSC